MFHTLLVPLDGSEFSERSLPMARGIARATSASIHLVQVHAPAVAGHMLSSVQFAYQSLDLEAYAKSHREAAQVRLQRIASDLEEEGLQAETAVLEGHVVDTLAEHATSSGADLIIMTTHGRTGANRMWLGSVADGLVRHTDVPLLLIHPPEDDPATPDAGSIGHILVPLDGSETAERILEPARDLARATGARVTLAHVIASHSTLGTGLVPLVPDDVVRIREQADAYLEEVAERLRAKGLEVEVAMRENEMPPTAIAEMAQELDADLIAIATHGRGGLRRAMLGSVADKVLRTSPLPLLVLRPGKTSAQG